MIPPGTYNARTCEVTIGRGEATFRFKLSAVMYSNTYFEHRIRAIGACRGITSRGRRCGRIGCRAHQKQRLRERVSVYAQMVGRTQREIYDWEDRQVAAAFLDRPSDIHVDEADEIKPVSSIEAGKALHARLERWFGEYGAAKHENFTYPGVCPECLGLGGDHERGTLCDACGGSGRVSL